MPQHLEPIQLSATNRTTFLAVIVALLGTCCTIRSSSAGDDAETFALECAKARAEAKENQWFSIQGDSPEWLFLPRELEHVGHGLLRERRLAVPRAVQPDDQAVAGELVGPYALDPGQILDARGAGLRRPASRTASRAGPETRTRSA